jgi:hypothetical protein
MVGRIKPPIVSAVCRRPPIPSAALFFGNDERIATVRTLRVVGCRVAGYTFVSRSATTVAAFSDRSPVVEAPVNRNRVTTQTPPAEPGLAPPAPAVRPWWDRLWRDPRAVWCLALVPHAVAALSAFRGITKGHHSGNLLDFVNAARALRLGNDLYASGSGGYVYPPLIAFLYQPLAGLSDRSAALVVLAVVVALSVFTLVIVSRVLVHRLVGSVDPLLVARVALLGAVCTADKIKGEFGHLETNVFMLLAFTAALRWVDRRPWLCGLALGFAFNIKYLPVVLVPYLLLRGRWRAVGWFAVWAVAWAILPAVSMGWAGDGRAWAEAGGGIGRLFGVHGAGGAAAAHVHAITDLVSISATSGLARVTQLPAGGALLLAAAVAAGVATFAAVTYARAGVPWVRWPAVIQQRQPPFRGLFTIEWMGLLLLMLALSPFTNSRHLYMLLDVNIAAAALLLGTGGRAPRLPLAVAMVGLWLGITFPPGSTRGFERADDFWRTVGGPGWCMLGMAIALVWTNVRAQRAVPVPVPMA